MTRDDVKKLFALMILAYSSMPELTTEKIDLWYEMLSEIDFETAKKAVKEHIKTSRFVPTIAEIREAVAENKPMYDDYRTSDTYREFMVLKDGENK